MANPDDTNRESQSLGKKIKSSLHQSGQSVHWLAESTHISLSTVYSILNGHQTPSLDKIRRICTVLNLSLDWLLEIESDSFYIRPDVGYESQTYAELEEFWLGEGSGERLSVSRGFSIVHQPVELRRQVLDRIYQLSGPQIEKSIDAFTTRRQIIDNFENRRVEIVVQSEIEDFVNQRPPWDSLDFVLIKQFIEAIVKRLQEDTLGLDVSLIPRHLFLVNYEIVNREIILFDLGHLFLRQSHRNVIDHFVREIQEFRSHPMTIDDRSEVIRFLEKKLAAAPGNRPASGKIKEEQR